MGDRILNFLRYCAMNNFDGSVCWYDKEIHITVSGEGNIYAYGQNVNPEIALNEVIEQLRKVGAY